MKLTIIRLQHFSDQDRIDLGKIWPSQDLSTLTLDENHRLYAARFNERLLGAVRVTLRGVEGELSDLCVREVTRRRGVGQYLVEERPYGITRRSIAGASPTAGWKTAA